MKTVRRNSKLFNKALDKSEKVSEYSLHNNFDGKEFNISNSNRWSLRNEFNSCRNASITTDDGINFIMSIHSNLWYSWSI